MQDDSERVLILAPIANDTKVAIEVLRTSGIEAHGCTSIAELCSEIENGCAAIVVADEALVGHDAEILQRTLRTQPSWSDLPVVLLSSKNSALEKPKFSTSGNISVLERPFARLTLITTVETAIRARRKQYHSHRLIEDQREAALRRDEFFATLSHELRTPLNVILGWTEILMNGDLDRAAQLEALKILDRNARVQKSLIDDLLDTSCIITGKLYFELAPVSLVAMIKTIHQEYQPRAGEKGLTLTLDTDLTEGFVFADEARLSQVFTNLITNAIKFTPQGGTISISLRRERESFVIRVRDSGQGMDSSFLPYVFDRLKQEDMTTTRAHGGLGLGLAITAHIVEQHHGKIQAFSQGRGKGSEFVVTLPVFEKTASVTRSPRPLPKSLSLEGVRVFVVDDSADIRQLIELWLKKAKAVVKLAGSGQDALTELKTFKPDVLLSDIGMPGMDGYEFIHRVRQEPDPKVRTVPAVALTAYAKDEERVRAIDAGFQLHISKPISNERLVEAITNLLEQ